ncbi:hypothetical protein P261_00581 [Lachnospiraceae bacterium TWA4]|nr:hypothetical protein P261_00581 [Lachnospiraceae bacterium TWA4]
MNEQKLEELINDYQNAGSPLLLNEAVDCFQTHWDFDAPNFKEMLQASLEKTGSLLDHKDFFPKATILYLADRRPEEIKDAFSRLFDETLEENERINAFYKKISELCEELEEECYHNWSVISTYLFLYSPNNYGLNQSDKYKKLKVLLDIGQMKYKELRDKVIEKVVEKLQVDSPLLAENILYYAYIKLKDHKETYPKNLILYGPPGTGKTYQSVLYSVAIIEDCSIEDLKNESYEKVYKRYLTYKEQRFIEFTTFHQSYSYEEFIEGIRPVLNSEQLQYKIEDGIFKKFCNENQCFENKVFIIDEINRGNISKIFGELITLIEPSRRLMQTEETMAKLPYSKEEFGVPSYVYIIGTMNTADHSLTLLDTALRRRFHFIETKPDTSIFENIKVEEVSIKELLATINYRLHFLYDDEHLIGQGYFIPLIKNPTIETLGDIFRNQLLPLLCEYFYDDYEKIQEVVGTAFIKVEEYNGLKAYSIDEEACYNLESYKQI